MNGICSAKLNESNLTSLGCLIGRKSHPVTQRCNLQEVPIRRRSHVSHASERRTEEESRVGGERGRERDIKMYKIHERGEG